MNFIITKNPMVSWSMLSNSEIYPFSLGMAQISVVWSDVLRAEGHSIKHFAPSFVKHLPFCRPKWDPVQHLLCPCVGQNGNLLSSNSCALVPLHLHLRPFKSIFQNHLHGDLARLNYQKKILLDFFPWDFRGCRWFISHSKMPI